MQWDGEVQTRRRRFRRMISVAHHLTFFIGTRFSKSVPLVFVLGYPKSGTSWVCQLTADYLRLPFPQHAILPVGFPAVVHGHSVVTKRFPRGIYVVRDGRDVMVSAFHHLRNQFESGGGKRNQRKFFRSIDLQAPLTDHLPAFIQHIDQHPSGAHCSWAKHVTGSLAANNDKMLLVRYEDLLADPESTLTNVFAQMTGLEVDSDRLRASLDRFSFTKQSGRSQGDESRTSYLRKGTSGDWRNYFDRSTAELFQQRNGEALRLAGYETDDQWVSECPESVDELSE